jgi:hypothetical protein
MTLASVLLAAAEQTADRAAEAAHCAADRTADTTDGAADCAAYP